MTASAVRVHHLPGILRIETDLEVPPERLLPRITTRFGRAWLSHGTPRPVPSAGSRRYVDIPCDLQPHRDGGRCLQLWAGGFLLHTEALGPAARRAGGIDAIEDYAVLGWIAGSDDPDAIAMLHVDGQPTGPMHELTGGSVRRLRCALPACSLDGRRHRIEIVLSDQGGSQTVAAQSWRSQARFDVGHRNGILSLRFADSALNAGAITLSGHADGSLLFQRKIDPGGTDLDWTIPPGAGAITLSAGEAFQQVLAEWHPVSPHHAVMAARARARAILLADPDSAADSRGIHRPAVQVRQVQPAHRRTASGSGRGVTVVVPVFGGPLETQSCLASLAASIAAGDAIDAVLIIDDASVDPAVATILAAFADPMEAVPRIVLRQDHNQGFAAAINRAVTEIPAEHDVILLNADTIVPNFFAARLRAAAHARPDIASATPLSNAASVLSLPDPQSDNVLTATEIMALDEILESENADAIDIPTGVGFCLYLKREALGDIGGFGLEWGSGYCEEVDWCLRARDRGWSHVAARDVAVFHQGSVSFGTAQKHALLARNHPMLERRYPEYTSEIQNYLHLDPLAPLRAAAFCRLVAAQSGECLLHFTHAMGGGTAILVDALSERFTRQGGVNLVCSRIHDVFRGTDVFVIRWTGRNLTLRLPHEDITGFVERLKAQGTRLAMVIHSLTGVGPAIRAIARLGIPYSVYAHDYQWICPRVVLVDQTGLHCGEPGPRYCQLCVRANPIHDFAGEEGAIRADLPGWIVENTRLLDDAKAVLVPSQDIFTRLRPHFPRAALRVLAHPERQRTGHIARAPDTDVITRIAIIGGLSVQKGRDVLLALCRAIDAASSAIVIEVFGAIEDAARFEGLACATLRGPYERVELASGLARFNPHFVFFPGVWPETWCFALSDGWAAGYPAVAFDIGAIAERIRATGAGIILPFNPNGDLIPALRQARETAARLHGLDFDIAPESTDDPARALFG